MIVDIPARQPVAIATGEMVRGLRVAKEPFEDARPIKSRLRTRSHLWGGESYFDAPGSSPSDAAPHALANYLNRHGWQAQVVKSGIPLNGADLTISGELLALSVNAKSRVGFTKLTTATKITIRALNRADGSMVRMTLNGVGSDSVFWFEPEDAQQLASALLEDGFSRLLKSTRMEGKVLKLPG